MPDAKKKTRNEITLRQLTKDSAEILNRVHYLGEEYVLVRRGKAIAKLVPPSQTRAA